MAKKTETKEKKEMTFETAMKRLETIVASLEDGTSPLDLSLELFTEGISLIKSCNEMLDSAEQKVRLLTEGKDGDLIEEPFREGSL